MPEAHIVRFKVITVECASMPKEQHYTITYIRGDTNCSTPCYVAENGVVDFSSMPEGAAIVHFKNGKMRFLPKWITFRIEEFTRGQPRKTVGETQLDCAEVLGMRNFSAAATRRLTFTMYGVAAHMEVALLVYPENHPPLSFGTLVPSQAKGDRNPTPAGKDVRRMTRSEAMRLLISLEALLEKHRPDVAAGKEGVSPLEQRLAQLEERRRTLSSVEGMATAVVKKRTEDVVAAQFVALSRKHRANFVGQVAAYLRQLAVTSGVSLTSDISEENVPNIDVSRERLQRINARIDNLTQQIQKLEEVQKVLEATHTRNSAGADVTSELAATVSKMETLRSQINLLTKSRASLEDVINNKNSNNTQIACEVQEIRSRIQALINEEKSLRENARRMSVIAANHVLKWARGKNAPVEDTHTDLTSLFGVTTNKEEKTEDVIAAESRSRILGAMSDIGKAISAEVKTDILKRNKESRKLSEKEASEALVSNSMEDTNYTAAGVGKIDPDDPLISDLGSHMFASSPHKESKNGNAHNSMPVLNFGSSSEADESTEANTATAENKMFSSATMRGRRGSGGFPVADMVSIEDDPMYELGSTAKLTQHNPLIEIDDSSFFQTFGGDTHAKKNVTLSSDGSLRGKGAVDVEPWPAYNFGTNNTTAKKQDKNESKLPMYDFGS